MSNNVPITVAHGDGIDTEIKAASLHIIQDAGAGIDLETIEFLETNEIGEKVYREGLELTMVGNRGVKVWPDGRVLEQGLEIVKTETLRSYNGAPGHPLYQGQ